MEIVLSQSLAYENKTLSDLLQDFKQIELYQPKVYWESILEAFNASSIAVEKWCLFLHIAFAPLIQTLKILAQLEFPYLKFLFSALWAFVEKHVWPPTAECLARVLAQQKAASPHVWAIEVGVCVSVVLAVKLRRFLHRKAYFTRACARVSELVAMGKQRWNHLIAVVAQKSKWAAQLLPHFLYWAGSFLVWYLFPAHVAYVAHHSGGRELIGIALPWVMCLHVLSLAPSSEHTDKYSQRLMYWVVFSFVIILHYLWCCLPKKVQLYTDHLGGCFLLLFGIWMQLPFGGMAILYGFIEPILEKYMKDLGPPAFLQAIEHYLKPAVTLRLLSPEKKSIAVELLHDSWPLTPCLLLIFTQSSIAYAAYIYAGAAVPAFNSIRALKKSRSTSAPVPESQELETKVDANCSALIQTKLRWLRYWSLYSLFWYINILTDKRLWFVPLLYHMQLVSVICLQLPFIRGADRLFRFFERFFVRMYKEIRTPAESDREKTAVPSSPESSTNGEKIA